MDLMVPPPLIFSPLREKCSELLIHLCYINILWSEVEISVFIFPSRFLRNITKTICSPRKMSCMPLSMKAAYVIILNKLSN